MKYHALRLIVGLLTFALGLISTTLLTGSRFNTVSNGNAEQEILQVEREYIQSHLRRDTVALDNILADEFTFRFREITETKAQWVSRLDDPDFDLAAINTTNVQIEVDGDSAIVTGEASTMSIQRGVKFINPQYRFEHRYEKRDGRWQIVSVKAEI